MSLCDWSATSWPAASGEHLFGSVLLQIAWYETAMHMCGGNVQDPFGNDIVDFTVMTYLTDMVASTRVLCAAPQGEEFSVELETDLERKAVSNMFTEGEMHDLHDTGDADHTEGKHRRMFEAARDGFDQSRTLIFEPSQWRPLEGASDLVYRHKSPSLQEDKKSAAFASSVGDSTRANQVPTQMIRICLTPSQLLPRKMHVEH